MTVPTKTYTLVEADAQRVRDLSALSDYADTVFVEVVYRNKWVRFDISAMEAKYLTPDVLMSRYFGKALTDVQATPSDGSEAEMSASAASSV